MSKNTGGTGNPMMDHASDKDKAQDMTYILTKFLSRGYDSLTNEELAVTLINPDYNGVFKKQTGIDWISKYQIQTIDKLKSVNFDLNFMTSSITHEKFNAFFVAVIKGDLEVIREYFRKYSDDELLRIVDVSKKSPLHHAAREGRTSVADYLMTKGFKVNARERTLKTPLHYACLFGHAVLADLLLKRGADIIAKDCSGRTCFHFACCSWSNEAIALVLGLKPELINLGDNIGRTGLHYAVWNSCDAQVDIIRTIVERGGNINQVDDYGKTALHYAAEGGRNRAIPILIQKGANMSIRETRTHKTPLELACNERTRELMVVYSSAPYTLKSRDKSFLDNAIKGESVVVKKQTIFNEEKVVRKPTAFVESIPVNQKSSNLVPEYWRSKMIKIMEQLQEVGVRGHQHIKRPYLFTGSWMEGVTTIEQLFDRIKGITANEAMLRLFNIMQPYEGDMPGENKDDAAISNFYGEYYNFEVPKETRVDLSAIGNNVIEQSKIAQIHSALELANKKNEELDSKISALLKDRQEYERMIHDLKTRNSELEPMKIEFSKLNESYRIKESSIFDLQKQREELERRLRDEVVGKDNAISALQKDLQDREIEVQKLKKEITLSAAKIKLLESKADPASTGGYGGSNMKVMNKFERKRYVAQELSAEDALALGTMMAKLRGNPPDLATRLRTEDKNADGLINSYEFLQAMEKLKLPPETVHALRTIAGFLRYDEIYIDDFVELVNRKANYDSQTEISYLEKFLKAFERKRMTVQDAMQQFDTDSDTLLDLGEFKQFVIDLGVTMDDKSLADLFRLLDTDNSGGVNVEELMAKLGALQSDKFSKDPEKAKQLDDKLKDQTKDKEVAPKNTGSKLKSMMKKLNAVDALDDAKDKNRDALETIDEAERLQRILQKADQGAELIKNNDLDPLVGEIKIQYQKLEKLQINVSDFKTFYLLTRLPGITKNWIEKEIYTHGLAAFKYAMRISIINVLEENVGKSVLIKLVGLNKQDLRVELGGCEVAWKKALEIPNEWVINNSFTLEAGTGKANPCDARIQLKWINAGSPEFKASIYDDYYLKKSFSSPKTEEGFLQITLASAILKDCSKKVSLKIMTPDQKSFTLSPEHTIGDERQFNKPFVCPLRFSRDDALLAIYLEVKQDKEVLGEAYINWSECIYFSREFSENKAFLLYKDKARTKHKVYLRFQFLTKAQAQLMNLEDKKDVAKDTSAFIRGIMKVGIVRAKNLIGQEKGDDGKLKSDPLVVFKFKNEDKYVKYTTDEVENNLNPIWNEDLSFGVKIIKGGVIPPFEIEVYDHDTWSANDLIGSAMIKPDACFSNPCKWALNGYFPLTEGEKKSAAGELYLRAYFVPDGTFDPNENPRDSETGEMMVIKTGKAKLHFRVVAGRDLVYLKDGIPQVKASPYLEVEYPNGKSSSSKPCSETLNPNWYYNYMGSVDLPEGGAPLAPVMIKVKHKTGMLSSDKVMSQLKVDLQRCVDNKGKWIINEVMPIPGEDKFLRLNNLKNMGSLYVQAKIVESSRIDDDVQPQMLIEMPKVGEGEIKGNFYIHLVHCKDLPKVDSGVGGNLCDPQIEFATKGGTTVESSVIWGTLNPLWNKTYVMPYKVSGIADVQPMKVTVYDKDKMSARDTVGFFQVDLMQCLTNPGQWGINKIFNIENIEEQYQVEGETPQIYFQIKYLPEGQVDDGAPAQLLEDIERTVKDRTRKGKLVIRVIHARGLVRGDSGLAGSLSDPYVEIKVPPNNKTYKTDYIKNTLIPHWKKEFVHPIEVSDIRYVAPMSLKVYDHDNLLVGGQDDLIGNVDIDLKPALNDSNAWAINKLFEMNGPSKLKEKFKVKNFGVVYVQVLFVKEGETQTTKQPALVEDIEALAKQSEVKGTLLVNVVHAKDLMRNDKPFFGGGPGSSDPFVRIKWPNGNESETKVRDGTVTPVWNELLKSSVELNKLNIPLLFVEVIDYEALKNDQLGYCSIDIDNCVMNPGKWSINGNFKLEGGSKFVNDYKDFGELYLQAMFLEGSTSHDGSLPPVTENLKEVIDRAAVKGTIEIRLIHAEDIKADDSSGKSDPYVIFTMPDKKEVKSKVIKDSLNPVWNQEIKHSISIASTVVEPVYLKLIDSDFASDDDLGKCSFNISECLKNPGKWLIDDFLKIEPMEAVTDKKAKPQQLGEIYLQARFVKEGMTDNTPPPVLKKDLAKVIQDKRVDGTLVVKLVHAKGLQVENPTKCKVYAEASIGDGKTQKTNYANERNPLFNQVFEFPIALESADFLKPVPFDDSALPTATREVHDPVDPSGRGPDRSG